MPTPRVAAVVLTYNGRDLLLHALPTLQAMDYPACDLVVVDNGSTDNTADMLAERFPDVRLVSVAANRGIPFGMDHGLQFAVAAEYDYLLLLNNDIEAAPDLLTRLLAVAEGDPTIACVGPKIFYYEERQRLWSAGGRLRFREAVTRERGMNQVDRGQFDRRQEVDYINGCAALVPAGVLQEVGPWDPIYFISVEDADWCMRARRRGYRCVYEPEANLWHMVSRSTGGYTAGRTFHTARSTAIFVRRYARGLDWLHFWLAFTVAIPAAMVREAPRGNAGAVWAKVRGVRAGMGIPRRQIETYPTFPWRPDDAGTPE